MRLAVVGLAALLASPAGPATDDAPRAAPEIPGARRLHVEPAPEAVERAERLRREVDDLRRRVAAGSTERQTMLEQARRLDQELALRRAEADEARARLEVEQAAAERAARRASSLSSKAAALRARTALVARALYRQGADEAWTSLLLGRASGETDLGRVLVKRDAELVADLRHAQAAADAALRDASRRTLAARRLGDEAAEREHAARLQADARQQQLQRLAEGVSRDAKAADEKEREAEALLSDLSAPALARRRPAEAKPQRDLALQGLSALRGLLPWPVETSGRRPRVLERFGEVVDPRRGTRTFRHGVELEARRGDVIRAVADGRVAFVDWYKGFGRCLVLEHGTGDLSVYAHADAFSVEAGDVVAQGEPIGEAGDTGSLEGPRLWFQIQRRGEPVDPLAWLRP